MAVNKDQPHIIVLPEDDANRQIALGFQLELSPFERALQVLRPSGGWAKVRDEFTKSHIAAMAKYPLRFMILLVDCDGKIDRLHNLRKTIPTSISGRVFLLGVLT